jgi:hypothetical protein
MMSPARGKEAYSQIERDLLTLQDQAERRRRAFLLFGCSTYTITPRNGVMTILCLCCGLSSAHLSDIESRYCSFCHSYHSEWRLKAHERSASRKLERSI